MGRTMKSWLRGALHRRTLLGAGLAGGAGALGFGTRRLAAALEHGPSVGRTLPPPQNYLCLSDPKNHRMTTVGEVDHARNGLDPHAILTDWDSGVVSTLPDGRRLRQFEITAVDQEIEIAPGVFFPAWTYNGRVPGPTLRATEGDLIRIRFANAGNMPHTLHFHGIHSARMDGVPGAGEPLPGEEFVYEFQAKPFGCHLYHCHSL